jgi:hypothetical protein
MLISVHAKEQPKLTFLVGGTGGGAIIPEISPLVASASESDVTLPQEMSVIHVSCAGGRYMPCIVRWYAPFL